MRKLKLFYILLSTIFIAYFFFVFPSVSCAQYDERILSFHSRIVVHQDSSMTVTETIRVRSAGMNIKRGIYRDFPIRYKDRFGNAYVVDFEVKEITRDRMSEAYHFANLKNGKRVYIGKKDMFLSPGEHTYTITYNTNRQLGFFKDFDELYWNVTGNGWIFPIDAAGATIVLPGVILRDELRLDGYTGPQGSKGKDFSNSFDEYGNVNFYTTRPLNPYEGLTIVVAWPKGLVSEPTTKQKLYYLFRDNQGLFIGLFGLATLLFYYFVIWANVGKDPARGTIIPLFEPPEKLSPSAVRYINRMGFDHRAFACAVINMAVKGFLSIREESGVYTLLKNKTDMLLLSEEEKKTAEKIFHSNEKLVIKSENHKKIANAIGSLKNSLRMNFEKVYFVTNRQYFIPGLAFSIVTVLLTVFSSPTPARGVAVFMSVWLTIWSIGVIFLMTNVINLWKVSFSFNSATNKLSSVGSAAGLTIFSIPFVIGEIMGLSILALNSSVTVIFILLSIALLNVLFYHLLKAPTFFGRNILDKIEGFKMFLSVSEKDRLNSMNPPQKTPELFEKFLPYALALGVEQAWAQQFSDILSGTREDGLPYSPGWYHGNTWNRLGAGGFSDSLGSSLTSAITSSSVAPGSSSGSGAGGSSGGGGGGGGGGGW